jgi:hypothetical protein
LNRFRFSFVFFNWFWLLFFYKNRTEPNRKWSPILRSLTAAPPSSCTISPESPCRIASNTTNDGDLQPR